MRRNQSGSISILRKSERNAVWAGGGIKIIPLKLPRTLAVWHCLATLPCPTVDETMITTALVEYYIDLFVRLLGGFGIVRKTEYKTTNHRDA